jgi:hypothetical protein
VRWNFERLNELEVYLPDFDGDPTKVSARDGFVRLTSSPDHAPHGRFNPASATGLGFDDLKTIEAGAFLKRVVSGAGPGPTIEDAVAAACLAAAAERAATHGGWEDV